jgi:hypothetical protein
MIDVAKKLDPYADDPEQLHFVFMGPMMTIVAGNERAKLTLTLLKLNRIELMEKRREKIDDLGRRLEEIVSAQNDATRRILIKALIEDETVKDKEFAACARAYVREKRRHGVIST